MLSRPASVFTVAAAAAVSLLLAASIFPSVSDSSSPDGDGKIVFTSNRDGNNEIYVMNADGSGQTRLTDNPAADERPSWSPDGTKIAFASDRDGNYEIYVMNADGSGQTRLTNDPGLDTDPAWSPDGTKIAFTGNRGDGISIYVMNADGSNAVRITGGTSPDWSPDGFRIAYERTTAISGGPAPNIREKIYIVNADGSGDLRLTPISEDSDWDPAWSNNGNHIAFSRFGFEGGMYVMNPDGSNPIRVVVEEGFGRGLTWSPDDSRIGYHVGNIFTTDIYAANVDGSGQTNLTNSPWADFEPDWLPAAQEPTPIGQTPSPTPVPGAVSGQVFEDVNRNGVSDNGEEGIPGASVCAYAIPSILCTTSDADGDYFLQIPSGSTFVSAILSAPFIPTTDLYETVDVPPGGEVSDVDFGFHTPQPVPPEVDLGECDRQLGGFTFIFFGCPLVVTKDVTEHCGVGRPFEVTLVIRFPFTMHAGPMRNVSGEIWEYVVPDGVLEPGSSASLEFYVDCPPDTPGFPADLSLIDDEDEIQLGGDIYIDPSGTIEDACTGEPVEGATVTLLVESPPGSGTFVQAEGGMIPDVNPQVTASDGLYGWMTVAGLYKVRAEKPGYGATESAELTIPPAVTDLVLAMTPDGGCTELIWGDANCSGSADPIDALLTLRFDASIPANTGDCPALGEMVDVVEGSVLPWGDVDCDGGVTPIDSLKLLRHDAGLGVSQSSGCPGIGTSVTLVE